MSKRWLLLAAWVLELSESKQTAQSSSTHHPTSSLLHHNTNTPTGIDAVVPKPLSASANVLVMTYCPGVKVTDPKGRCEYMYG